MPDFEWLRKLATRAGKDVDADVAEELRLHQQERAEELERTGLARAEAMLQARRELGGTLRAIEDSRAAWRLGWLEDLFLDLRYGARSLLRDRGFALAGIASLALGIGVNTTVFSLASEFLFSEPSVRDASTLVSIRVGGNSHARPEEIRFLRDAGIYEGLSGFRDSEINWRVGDTSRRLFSFQVGSDFFTLLGVPFQAGRAIQAGDTDVAVLSHRLWTAGFQREPGIVGRTITLDGRPHTVIGILPEGHRTVAGFGLSPDIFVPVDERRERLAIYARMREGMSRAEALERTRAAAEELDRIQRNESYKRADNVRVSRLSGLDRLTAENLLPLAGFFAILMAAVDLVLLIACINVASLMLARAASRSNELAVRASIGASRGRIVRQLLAESLLLSGLAAAAGIGINLLLTRALNNVPLPLPLPIHLHMAPDWRLLVYGTVMAILTAVAAGLLPAWRSSQFAGPAATLGRGGRATGSGTRLRSALVACQVAVTFVVLASTVLFLRNLARSSAMNPGFEVNRLVWASMRMVPERYVSDESIDALASAGLERLRGLPGVESASLVRVVPFQDQETHGNSFRVEGMDTVRINRVYNRVAPDYFRTMGIPLVAGREFQPVETNAVIINQALAERLVGSGNAVGRVLRLANDHAAAVIGVCRNTKFLTIGEDDKPALYEPYKTDRGDRRHRMQWMIRTQGAPANLVHPVEQALLKLDPAAAVEVKPMPSAMGLALLPSQVGAALMGAIGLLGLVLASAGLYGVLLYAVVRRRREIGVRMALGARASDVLRMVLGDASRIVGIGMAAGLAAAILLMRPLAAFLVAGLEPDDPVTFAAVAAVLAVVAMAACVMPSIRAVRVDPVEALRTE